LIIFVVAFASVRAFVLSPGVLGDKYNQEKNADFWKNDWPLTYSNGNEYGDTCANCHDDVYGDWLSGGHGPIEWEGPDGPALEDVRPGVSCETCHGPALEHLNAKGKEAKQATKPAVEGTRDFCGLCHKEIGNPDVGPRTAVPTQDLNKHGGRAACVECHNPHDPAPF
jgi:hypothetical protein